MSRTRRVDSGLATRATGGSSTITWPWHPHNAALLAFAGCILFLLHIVVGVDGLLAFRRHRLQFAAVWMLVTIGALVATVVVLQLVVHLL